MSTVPIRRALVSVYDKTGLEELGRALVAAGVEIVSTGSTAGRLAAAGLPVTPVEALTGFPECLDGRVKTLHPRVHAGVLADLRNPDHERQLAELDIAPFQLVVVNLYPFAETVASGASAEECVEQIDIGGPSMVRAAAKNHANVAVVVSPSGYEQVVRGARRWRLRPRRSDRRSPVSPSSTPPRTTSRSRAGSATSWRRPTWSTASPPGSRPGSARPTSAPTCCGTARTRTSARRSTSRRASDGLAQAEQLHGKQMSYNNYVDTDAALRACQDFEAPTVAIIKHANPCGIASAETVAEAHFKANACDPASAFGGVIAVNRPVSVAMAEQVNAIFTEAIIAPSYEPGAVEILARKPSIRVLRTEGGGAGGLDFRQICGGLLLQTADTIEEAGDGPDGWTLVDRRARRRGDPGRPRVRLAGLPGGQVQRDPARLRRRLGRHRHGPGQPGRLLPARGPAGR